MSINSMPVQPLHTTHCLDGISPFDRLSVYRLAPEGGRSISTLDACVLNIEEEEQIQVSIVINVHQVYLDWSGPSASGAKKEDRSRFHRSGIKGSRCQNGHLNPPMAARINDVGEIARSDVNHNRLGAIYGNVDLPTVVKIETIAHPQEKVSSSGRDLNGEAAGRKDPEILWDVSRFVVAKEGWTYANIRPSVDGVRNPR
jgi:hypothetical protein